MVTHEQVYIDVITRQLGENLQGLSKNLVNNLGKDVAKSLKNVNEESKEATKGVGKLGRAFNYLFNPLKKFKMEMLGVMFFGAMLQRTMLGLLQPAQEMYGITELWSMTMAVLFLPIMQELFPVLLTFMKYLMSLDPAVQTVIGGIVLAVLALGTLLFTIGMSSLGVTSIIDAWTKISKAIDGVGTSADTAKSAVSNLSNLLGAGVSVYLMYSGLKDLSEGNILKGLGESMTGVGWWIPGAKGKVAAGIGIALVLASITRDKETITPAYLVETLVTAGFAGYIVGGPWGVAISIGVTLVALFWDKITKQFEEFLDWVALKLKDIPFLNLIFKGRVDSAYQNQLKNMFTNQEYFTGNLNTGYTSTMWETPNQINNPISSKSIVVNNTFNGVVDADKIASIVNQTITDNSTRLVQ